MSDFEFFNLGKDAAGHIDERRRVALAKTYATTGKINADGSVTVVDSGATSHVWVKVDDNQAETKSVLNKKTGVDRHRAGGIGVWLVWIEAERIYEIDSLASASNLTTLDASLLSTFESPTQAGDLSQSTVPNGNLKNIRVRVSSGLTVYIEPGYFYVGTTLYSWPGGTLDLTASVPAAGMKAPVIIGIDSATLTAVAYKGTEVVQSLPPAGGPYFFGADFVAARNAATGFDAALFGIGLRYGQTAITDQADFVDLRAEQVNGSGGSFTSFDVDADSGGPSTIVDGDTLTIVGGTNVTTSLSGDTLTIDASGGGGGWTEGARAFNSANISINNTTDTYLTFDSERYDTDTIHSTVTNTGRLTATTAGIYLITGQVRFAANATGRRETFIRYNGTDRIAATDDVAGVTGTDPIVVITSIWQMAATDYVELGVWQNSGGALNVVFGTKYSPEFMMQRIG